MAVNKVPIEAEDLSVQLTGLIARIIIDEWTWRAFGYKSRPRRGRFFNRFVDPEALAEERFLTQELLFVSLARVGHALGDLLDNPLMGVAVFARVLEQLVDGDRPGENVWRSLSFPSREAALQGILDGVQQYRDVGPPGHAGLFAKRMIPVVRQKSRSDWISGVAILFTVSESPITNIYWPLEKVLEAGHVVGRVSLRDRQYLEIAEQLNHV